MIHVKILLKIWSYIALAQLNKVLLAAPGTALLPLFLNVMQQYPHTFIYRTYQLNYSPTPAPPVNYPSLIHEWLFDFRIDVLNYTLSWIIAVGDFF